MKRTGLLRALVAAIVVAAAVGGGYWLTRDDDPATQRGPAGSPTVPVSPAPTATNPPAETVSLPVYFAGDTHVGPRLYAEVRQLRSTGSPALAAVNEAMTGTPDDPDYHSLWPEGASALEVHADGYGDHVQYYVVLPDASLQNRPTGLTPRDAELAIEQVTYTLEAVGESVGMPNVAVGFYTDGGEGQVDQPINTVLGVPTNEPLVAASPLRTLSHVNLSTPREGEVVSGGTLQVSGLANSFEANVVLRLQRYEGTHIVLQEPVTAEGYMDDKLFPFSAALDVSGVQPGKYILMAMTDDPSGEGNFFTDGKVIQIQ